MTASAARAARLHAVLAGCGVDKKPGSMAGFFSLMRRRVVQNCHHDFFVPGRACPVMYGLSGNVPASTRFVSSASCG